MWRELGGQGPTVCLQIRELQITKDLPPVAEARSDPRVARTVNLIADSQRPNVQRFGLLILALNVAGVERARFVW